MRAFITDATLGVCALGRMLTFAFSDWTVRTWSYLFVSIFFLSILDKQGIINYILLVISDGREDDN